MTFYKLNLQLFGEGGGDGSGDGASASAFGGADSEATSVGEIDAPKKGRKSNPLANVVYGKQDQESGTPTETNTTMIPTKSAEEKTADFENLIKGDYKAEFDARVQSIINKRFGEDRKANEQISKMQPILDMLSSKYGADATDLDALTKAIQDDDSYYEEEAIKKGLTVKQIKEMKALERENASLKAAREQLEMQQKSDEIYARWMNDAQRFNEKYGISIDFKAEAENPDFQAILKSGGSVEAAYMAVHFDDMVGGAMFKTAQTVSQKMANNLQSRSARPTENGISSRATAVTKTDVNSLTRKDREEIERRVMRGERISF